MHYVKDTAIPDTTPPPTPTRVQVKAGELTWSAAADLESGIRHFIIVRDGKQIATVPDKAKNRYGRPLFQGLQHNDTPAVPLVEMRYVDTEAQPGASHSYRVITVNTAGLESR